MKKTFAYDFLKGDFIVENGNIKNLEGVEALKLWIEKLLLTQLGKYQIYKGTNYGANIEDLVIGNTYGIDFTESELKRELETALLEHDDIDELNSFSLSVKGAVLSISFTLKTAYGELTEVFTYDA